MRCGDFLKVSLTAVTVVKSSSFPIIMFMGVQNLDAGAGTYFTVNCLSIVLIVVQEAGSFSNMVNNDILCRVGCEQIQKQDAHGKYGTSQI